MATRIDENSQPALRLVGRNSNPLVANVISPAFAKKSFWKRRDNRWQDSFSAIPHLRDRGLNPDLPAFAGRFYL
jgi:hypothetical protein